MKSSSIINFMKIVIFFCIVIGLTVFIIRLLYRETRSSNSQYDTNPNSMDQNESKDLSEVEYDVEEESNETFLNNLLEERILWEKTINCSEHAIAFSALENSRGDYIIVGKDNDNIVLLKYSIDGNC